MGIRSVALDRHGEQYTKAIEGQVAAHTVLEEAARQWRVSLSENPHGYKSIKQGWASGPACSIVLLSRPALYKRLDLFSYDGPGFFVFYQRSVQGVVECISDVFHISDEESGQRRPRIFHVREKDSEIQFRSQLLVERHSGTPDGSETFVFGGDLVASRRGQKLDKPPGFFRARSVSPHTEAVVRRIGFATVHTDGRRGEIPTETAGDRAIKLIED